MTTGSEAPRDAAPRNAAPEPGSPAPRRRRRRWRAILRLIAGAVAIPLVFALVLPVLLIGQDISAPSWVVERIEAQAGRALNGGRIRFGGIGLTVGADLHPVARLTEVTLSDATGAEIVRVPRVEILFSPRALVLQREALAQEIVLSGAQLALRRAADGSVALAFGGGAVPVGEAPSLAALPGVVDALFARSALAALEQVRAEGLILNYDDARAGRAWTLDDGRLSLDLRDGRTRLAAAAALLSGRDFVTTVTLDYDSPRDSPEAAITVEITDAVARDIATQSAGLSWLAVLDARLSARISAGIGPDGGLAPLAAELTIAAGSLRPDGGAQPVAFDRALADLVYDPGAGAIRFARVEAENDWGAVTAEGTAYLRDMAGGLPQTLIAQFRLEDIRANPAGLYPEALRFPGAYLDFRMQLEPFVIEVGHFGLRLDRAETAEAPARLEGSARIAASPEGWEIAVDVGIGRIGRDRAMALWPPGWRPGTRRWFEANLTAGTMTGVRAALRRGPEAPARLWMTQSFEAAEVRPMARLPPITGAAGRLTLADDRLTVALEAGRVRAPQGGEVDLAGSTFVIPDTRMPGPEARVVLRSAGTITAALSLLDQPPFGFSGNAGLPVTLADGRARSEAEIGLRLMPGMPREALSFSVRATLSDLRSERLVPGRVLAARALTLTADDGGLRIEGPLRIGRVPMEVAWSRRLGPGSAGTARAEGTVELSERFLDEFRIALPPGSLSGAGQGRFALDFPAEGAPGFTLSSDLRGITLRLPALGWSKGAGTAGRFEIAGRLGAVPEVERIALEAAGLTAQGSIRLRDGGLERARFDRLRLGGWLDVAVSLVGRGPGRPVGIEVAGGTLNLRRATFGGGGEGGEGGPLTVRLDRLQVAEGIALTGLAGEFTLAGGLSGTFGAAINGGARVAGTLAPIGGRTAVRLRSETAGEAIRDAGLLRNARGGALDLTLLPTGAPGTFDGRMAITGGLRVIEAPVLASLLNAISVVGLLQQMAGQGLVFDTVEAEFRLAPETITVLRSSAVGPGLGISLDGYYRTATREMDFQGVVSPLYLVNAIGSILTRPGEGLIGFNFTLSGPVGDMAVGVNPLSALTPGMFREIFRRPPPEVTE